jgi:hypothetical protein
LLPSAAPPTRKRCTLTPHSRARSVAVAVAVGPTRVATPPTVRSFIER